ncbi:hypothetical protein C8Q76DRAFT_238183 [Earliella scabrosa]|nr:hypothetical protein C8Q76DRAFT_238183 [Earliella scabrosa]
MGGISRNASEGKSTENAARLAERGQPERTRRKKNPRTRKKLTFNRLDDSTTADALTQRDQANPDANHALSNVHEPRSTECSERSDPGGCCHYTLARVRIKRHPRVAQRWLHSVRVSNTLMQLRPASTRSLVIAPAVRDWPRSMRPRRAARCCARDENKHSREPIARATCAGLQRRTTAASGTRTKRTQQWMAELGSRRSQCESPCTVQRTASERDLSVSRDGSRCGRD